MNNAPSNTDDTIDSRDVIARIEELEAERECLAETLADCEDDTAADGLADEARAELADWDASEEAAELDALKALAKEAEGYAADWHHGETLIRDSYFIDYAQELAEECGMMDNAASWPNTCIDWEQAARELQYDYTSVEFDGVTYWVR